MYLTEAFRNIDLSFKLLIDFKEEVYVLCKMSISIFIH